MKKKLLLFTGLLCMGFTTAIGQESSDSLVDQKYTPRPYLGIQVGSMGAGLQFSYPIGQRFGVRVGGSYLPEIGITAEGSSSGADVSSDYRFETGSASLIADYSPFKNRPGIKVALGAVYNMTKISATNAYYLPDYDEDLGNVGIEITPGFEVNPYLGIVLGNAGKAKRLSYAFELGALYQGQPNVTMTGSGRIEPTANESNTAIIENNIKSYQVYPYANFQLNFYLTKQ